MNSMLRPHVPARQRAASLNEADRLLLWALRTWIRGVVDETPCNWSSVWNMFALRFGTTDGKVAVASLSAMVRRLSDHARRPFVYHQPECGCLGEDELELLRICILASNAAETPATRRAGQLVAEPAVDDFVRRGARLARLFADNGLALSDPWTIGHVAPDEAQPASRPAGATLH